MSSRLVNFFYGFSRSPFRQIGSGIRLACTDVAGRPHSGRCGETIRHDSRGSGFRLLRDEDRGDPNSLGTSRSGADATAMMKQQRLWFAAPLEFGLGFHRFATFIINQHCLGLTPHPRLLAHALQETEPHAFSNCTRHQYQLMLPFSNQMPPQCTR